jgi:hypothetical protein
VGDLLQRIDDCMAEAGRGNFSYESVGGLLRDCRDSYAAGYRAGLEAAAKACETLEDQYDGYATTACAQTIRALTTEDKQQTWTCRRCGDTHPSDGRKWACVKLAKPGAEYGGDCEPC